MKCQAFTQRRLTESKQQHRGSKGQNFQAESATNAAATLHPVQSQTHTKVVFSESPFFPFLIVKLFFLMSNLNLPSLSLKPLHLVLLLHAFVRNPSQDLL